MRLTHSSSEQADLAAVKVLALLFWDLTRAFFNQVVEVFPNVEKLYLVMGGWAFDDRLLTAGRDLALVKARLPQPSAPPGKAWNQKMEDGFQTWKTSRTGASSGLREISFVDVTPRADPALSVSEALEVYKRSKTRSGRRHREYLTVADIVIG